MSAVTGIEVTLMEQALAADDAACEVQWSSDEPVCGAPADWMAVGHSASEHEYLDCRLCTPCLDKIKSFGLMTEVIACAGCAAAPIVKSVRPI
jgi:hypothetical protein